MCRSIKTLRVRDVPTTDTDINAAALQFVRKVSGFRTPSARNQAAFETAVEQVAMAARTMLVDLGVTVD